LIVWRAAVVDDINTEISTAYSKDCNVTFNICKRMLEGGGREGSTKANLFIIKMSGLKEV
jgi:hypothetical protein